MAPKKTRMASRTHQWSQRYTNGPKDTPMASRTHQQPKDKSIAPENKNGLKDTSMAPKKTRVTSRTNLCPQGHINGLKDTQGQSNFTKVRMMGPRTQQMSPKGRSYGIPSTQQWLPGYINGPKDTMPASTSKYQGHSADASVPA